MPPVGYDPCGGGAWEAPVPRMQHPRPSGPAYESLGDAKRQPGGEPREPCQFRCGRTLPARLLPCHVATECPFAPVACSRAHRGCPFVCERESLPEHARCCPYRRRQSPQAGGSPYSFGTASPTSAGSRSPGSDRSVPSPIHGFVSFALPPPAVALEGRVPTYPPSPEFLALRITDPVGTLEFRMRRNAEFHKMFVKYGRQRGLCPSEMMFSATIGGNGTPLREFHTPAALGLTDGDEIIAVPMALAMTGEDSLSARNLLAIVRGGGGDRSPAPRSPVTPQRTGTR